MKRFFSLSVFSGALAFFAPVAHAATPLINCPNGFTAASGSQCTVQSFIAQNSTPANNFGRVRAAGTFNGTQLNLAPASGSGHGSAAVNFMQQVPVTGFTAHFNFVPNGWNIALVFNNSTNTPDWDGIGYVSGAGVEGGFYQNPGPPHPGNPDGVFAIMFDQWSSLTAGGSNFTYSSVQDYVSGQYPGNPNLSSSLYFGTNKVSTSPVPLNLASSSFTGSISGNTLTVTNVISGPIHLQQTVLGPGATVGDGTVITAFGTGTGGTGTYTVAGPAQSVPSESLTGNAITTATQDTYSTTISYDGSNLNLCLYDVTAANGSCSSATSGTGTFFQHTWTGVNIPAAVGNTSAWLGLTSSSNRAVPWDLFVNSFVYTADTPANPLPFTAWNANTTTNNGTTNATASPVYSVAPGSYSAQQTVKITDSTAGANICTVFVPTGTSLTVLPQANNQGGCGYGTVYSAPVSITQSGTLYASAGTNYTAPPSKTTAAVYTITSGTAGACDINQDGSVNAADVQSAVNQVLGIAPCGTADLQSNGQCTAIDVQRVVNTVLGGQCVVGP